MAKEITTEFIKGGTCPICGANFGEKWGKLAKNNIKFIDINIDTGTGPSALRLRVCRSHEVDETEKQWLLDCHKEFYKEEGKDSRGQNVMHAENWKLTEGE